MKIALVKPPKGNSGRGVGFYAERLMQALTQISGLEPEWVDHSKNPLAYQKFDLVHFPYFDLFNLTVPPIRLFRTIVTLHDCIPLKFPKSYPLGKKAKLILPFQEKILRGVDALITDSQNSREDIVEILKIDPQKIFVTHLAADPTFKKLNDHQILESVRKKYSLPPRFVLYTGGVNWNKNVGNLIKACDENLVLVGKEFTNLPKNLSHPELAPLEEVLGLIKERTNVKVLGFVETGDLVALYNLASLYVQPSIYEGFGLPVLEAMSAGCPVVCGKGGSLAEIVGDAAVIANVESVADLKQKIKQTLSMSKSDLKKMQEKCQLQATKFSWEKTAAATKSVYQKVLKP